jgi:hypothetical protein
MVCLRLNFYPLLSVTLESRCFDILSTNNSMKICENLTSLLGMSTETRVSGLMKKPVVKKSRWTIRLSETLAICLPH